MRLVKVSTLAISILALLVSAVPVLHYQPAHAAAGLFGRSLTLGDPGVSATTDYVFQFDITSATNLGSILFEFCSNNPLPFEPCTPPSGFDISGAFLTAQSGEVGFSIDGGATNANNLLLTRIPALATPQTVSYTFDPTDNPDSTGTYYVRLYTYATDDGSGPTTEEAGIAFSINDSLNVTAFVPPFLEFCVGISVPGPDCATALGSFIDFGTLSDSTPRTGISQMSAATNGVGGVAISMIGTTMTSGINTIAGLNTRTTSNPGTSQFGVNLRNNSSPNVGENEIGPGSIAPTADYNVVNQFTFRDGDTVATSPISTNFSRVTASYIVNVSTTQAAGVYTTTLTYVATATF